MGEAVQNRRPGAELLNRQTVVLLVQEKARLLPVLHIHLIADAVFGYHNIRIKRFREETFRAFHALELSDLRIASLVHAAKNDAVLREDIAKRRENHILEAVRSQGKGLNHADVLEFVHHDSGKPVGLAENHPAGRGVHGFLSILPRRADALP